jgi:hypothetical protein
VAELPKCWAAIIRCPIIGSSVDRSFVED